MGLYLIYLVPTIAVSSWFIQTCNGLFVQKQIYQESEQNKSALEDFVAAGKMLEAWLVARPRLYVSQSEYARSLVQMMIDSFLIMLTFNSELDRKTLATLYKLLNGQPPSHNPPAERGSLLRRAFLFSYKPDGRDGFGVQFDVVLLRVVSKRVFGSPHGGGHYEEFVDVQR